MPGKAAPLKSRSPDDKRPLPSWLATAAIVIATFIAYLPALNAGFIWDDDDYVTHNDNLRDVNGLARLWVPGTTHQYYPVVFTTFWIERQLWDLHPTGYHVVNVLLHAMNAVLVWRLAKTLRMPGAWMIGAVFVLHPVHVESVAWVTERKNVLSALLYLLAAMAYLRFDESSAAHAVASNRQIAKSPDRQLPWRWYVLSLLLFTLALLSKSVTCSLPAALILMVLWQRKRLTITRLLPLVPMFAIGLVLALHTAHLEKTNVGALGSEFAFTAAQRVLIASRALLFYPDKLLVPWPLTFIYPRWQIESGQLIAYWPVAVIMMIGSVAMISYLRGWRGPLLALLFYAGTILPALGFVNIYPMRFSFVADHFQYLASLGIIALVVGIAARALRGSRVAVPLAAVVILALGALTWQQCWAYQSEEALWRWTINQNPGAWIAHNNLSKILSDRGEQNEALVHLQKSVELYPQDPQLHANLARELRTNGQFDAALDEFEKAELQYASRQNAVEAANCAFGIAQALDGAGRVAEAEAAYRRALAMPQFNPDTLMWHGRFLLNHGRAAEAAEPFRQFADTHPHDAFARLMLADALAASGQIEEALHVADQARMIAMQQQNDRLAGQIAKRMDEYRAGKTTPPK